MEAIDREQEKAVCDLWLSEHPGRTAAQYRRTLGDDSSEVWKWRRAKSAVILAAEREAWERDHPGEERTEHLCSLE